MAYKIHQSLGKIEIRPFIKSDIFVIVSCFSAHQNPKSQSIFDVYFSEQEAGDRLVWIAYYGDQFAGYCTLKWQSDYESFREQGISEIKDLNVLPSFRCKGIGSKLLETAENEAFKRGNTVGIGAGLYEGYGNAQKLYIARNYIPDGLGITYNYMYVEYGEKIPLDDDLVLWFTKNKLNDKN